MDRDEILEQVLEFLRGVLEGEDGHPEGAGPDASYVLDSLAVVEVVTFLEERFGLTLERSDLDFIDTPAGIVDLVASKRAVSG